MPSFSVLQTIEKFPPGFWYSKIQGETCNVFRLKAIRPDSKPIVRRATKSVIVNIEFSYWSLSPFSHSLLSKRITCSSPTGGLTDSVISTTRSEFAAQSTRSALTSGGRTAPLLFLAIALSISQEDRNTLSNGSPSAVSPRATACLPLLRQ